MPATSPIRGKRRVRKAEFIRLAVSIFGPKWKRPTGRLVGRTSKMVRNYAAGSFDIPDTIMDVLKKQADIGPAGQIIKKVVLRSLVEPTARTLGEPQKRAHERAYDIAVEAVREMTAAGVIRSPGER